MFYKVKLKIALSIISILLLSQVILAQAVSVEVIKIAEDQWQLLRDGQPYYIMGAGGSGSKDLLAAAGANTFRTWGVGPDLGQQLDHAQELGLTVVVGHWLGHPRHGFDYNDTEALEEQFARVRSDVLKYKDHPAVLLWGIGNEMEGFAEGDDPAVWTHVQALAAMIKELDPNHPTMTVTAEIGGSRVEAVHKLCPDIDIIGINSYGGVPSLLERYNKLGGYKPFIITEFGPPGVWEITKTKFGAPPELTSTEKAEFYRTAYEKGILDSDSLCLGSFAFTWGSKVEVSSTWYGMYLSSGEKLAAVDAMTEMWSGHLPDNLCPEIRSFNLVGPDIVQSGDTVEVKLDVVDPEGTNVTVNWLICVEPSEYLIADQAQWVPLELDNIITSSSSKGATLTMPGGGIYRLYMTAHDGFGGAATANVPIKVEGKPAELRLKFPLAVYADGFPQPWAYSGWMGNHEALTIDPECKIQPYSGNTCMKIRCSAPFGWTGVAWQNPANDWGDKPGGYDLTGAKKLTFWAKGEMGGELIDFGVGLLNSDKEFHDTAKVEFKSIKLKKKWKQYSINLKGKDLSNIKIPFYWISGGNNHTVTFYLDDIQFE
ncbi:MAG: glycoside hydrolase family 2 TIM barrel-domain containing protein [Candidatus Tenebribacter davisii]|nr:glycoside hydrolase family 2 TIM barrel-domain containing protein [Candidatus Tenebribacter davisii]